MTGAHTVWRALIKPETSELERRARGRSLKRCHSHVISVNVTRNIITTGTMNLLDRLYFKTVNFTQDAPSELAWPPSERNASYP